MMLVLNMFDILTQPSRVTNLLNWLVFSCIILVEHLINGLIPPVFLPIKLLPSCCANNSALIANNVSIPPVLGVVDIVVASIVDDDDVDDDDTDSEGSVERMSCNL